MTSPGPHPDTAARLLLSVLPCSFIAVAAILSFFVRLGGKTGPGRDITITQGRTPEASSDHDD